MPQRPPFGLLPSPPIAVPLEATVSPADGTGQLIWYEAPLAPKLGARLVLRFASQPWSKTGVQPFAWNWVGATGANRTPILRVAVARRVWVTQAFAEPGGTEHDMRVGSSPPLAGLGPGRPRVVLYRPQDDGLIPDPEESFESHSIVGEPYTIFPESFERLHPALRGHVPRPATLQVTPYETGVVIANSSGRLEVHVRLTDPGVPAAFAFDVGLLDGSTSAGAGTFIRIVHTRGVEVHVRAHESFHDFVVLTSLKHLEFRGQTLEVPPFPPQGAELAKDDYRFFPHETDELVPDSKRLLTILLFELAINLVAAELGIPIVGVLYDLGQLAYTAATGKNFWGYQVSSDELVLMGFTAALPLAAGAGSTIRSLQARVRATKLARILEAETLAEVQRVADTGFVEAVGQLSSKQVDTLATALERHLADPRAMPLAALVGKLNDLIGEAYVLSLEKRILAKVFKEDFSGFRHPQLAAAYNKYKSSPRFRRNPGLAEDPAAWAKRQSAATTGTPRLLLRQALGDDFVAMINRTLKDTAMPRQVTKADIDNFDKLVRLGVLDYGTLRNAAKKLPGFGQLFELDHLLEQRFWRNNPALRSAFDEKGLGMAFAVPKNAAVSRSMFIGFGGKRIRYVHTVKTRMLRELIPNGSEALFTVQETWDAHIHVLKSLGADPSLYGQRLAEDFGRMAAELHQQFTPHVPSPTRFLHENGWPRVFENPDGSWTITRTR